jgi:hypothetical protein
MLAAGRKRHGLTGSKQKKDPAGGRIPFAGAKDGSRTRDLDLGKVALYQLSYFRVLTPEPGLLRQMYT